ncbi:hypothetical protein CRG98_027449 [Punica granatum]|uniref:Uncharacterized protein n=1 Tax=Punica granatum TaxID=22663 RepID=A0A2I0J7Z3_PUNGR|nr:hypothetical protein CRG98_027449 [Punica granatum]
MGRSEKIIVPLNPKNVFAGIESRGYVKRIVEVSSRYRPISQTHRGHVGPEGAQRLVAPPGSGLRRTHEVLLEPPQIEPRLESGHASPP